MEEERKIIRDILLEKSRFVKYYEPNLLDELVGTMKKQNVVAGKNIMFPSQSGKNIYVFLKGAVRIKIKAIITVHEEQNVYGEEEVLLNKFKETYIKAVDDCSFYVLSKRDLRQCIKRCTNGGLDNFLEFSKSVSFLRQFTKETLDKMKDSMEVESYDAGQVIPVLQHKIYILSSGHANVTAQLPDDAQELETLRVLRRGDHFCKATPGYITPFPPGVDVISFDEKLLNDVQGLADTAACSSTTMPEEELADLTPNCFERVHAIASGFNSSVDLVSLKKDTTKTYIIKKIKKVNVVRRNIWEDVLSERDIHLDLSSPFITRCFRTMRCDRFVYFLMEACLGGDLFRVLGNRRLKRDEACFVMGCITEALSFLHSKQIVYRDLKPENLVIDSAGYVKLTDFGLSKQLGVSGKCFGFCGTEDYLAPEMVLNLGHDRALDLWTMGIVLYEMVIGSLPFPIYDNREIGLHDSILVGIEKAYFSNHIGEATDLITGLCRRDPSARVGYRNMDEIREHSWFRGFDWTALKNLTLPPPKILVPNLVNSRDTRYFEYAKPDDTQPMEEKSNWDIDF